MKKLRNIIAIAAVILYATTVCSGRSYSDVIIPYPSDDHYEIVEPLAPLEENPLCDFGNTEIIVR